MASTSTINMSLTMALLITLSLSMFWTQSMAQSSSSCTSVLISMSPCLNFVTGSSSTPTSSCCSQLANVVKSQPECLCFALGGGASSLGITINRTLALELPGACKVQTPPVSECNRGAPPVGSAADSRDLSPFGSAVGAPETSADGGSKTVPVSGGISAGNRPNMNATLQLLLFVVFVICRAWKCNSF